MDYELHPLCTLFPRIVGEEFETLVQDIKAHGLREPIILHDGMVLDGGNRLRACIAAGVKPGFMNFGGGNLVEYVLSTNLHRRHLTAAQRSAITASVTDWATAQAHGGNRKADQVPDRVLDTAKKRAEISNSPVNTQRKADKVAKENPELIQAVARGEVSLDDATRQVAPQLVRPKKKKKTPEEKRAEKAALEAAEEARREENDRIQEQEFEIYHNKIADLEAEVARLKECLAIGIMPEEDQEEAKTLIADLKEKLRIAEISLRSTEKSRDYFQNENAQMKGQIAYWKREHDKLKKLLEKK